MYMEKLVVGPNSKGKVSLDYTVEKNLEIIADSLNRDIDDLMVVILNRTRHEELISRVQKKGARVTLIEDGDVAPAIAAAVKGTGIHAVMGTGGAPEGVLTAAAMRCLGGELHARFVLAHNTDPERVKDMGVDMDRIYTSEDLAPGDNILVAASGVTTGPLLKGVNFFGGGSRVHTLLLTKASGTIRFVESVHVDEDFHGAVQLF